VAAVASGREATFRLETGGLGRAAALWLGEGVLELFQEPGRVSGVAGSSEGLLTLRWDGAQAQRLMRRAGLVSANGALVRGMPPGLVSGPPCDALAAWQGVVVVAGVLSETPRTMLLEVACPCEPVAYALAGMARRLGTLVRTRETATGAVVGVRGDQQVGGALDMLKATRTSAAWRERPRRDVRLRMEHTAVFESANRARSRAAAQGAREQVRRALDALGDSAPSHLRETGLLRLEHEDASLEELGRLCTPPLSKDTVAGRLRRLTQMVPPGDAAAS
jgi:DNA-binding protein WhiA